MIAASPLVSLSVAVTLAVGASGPTGPPRTIHELHLQVDGGTVRALCTDGARRVMLWHGEGATAETWRPVLERLDASIGACAFDRMGSGESGPTPEPRGWLELVDELRRIHLALGFEHGYVLVAHSLAGLYARLYAADRPNDLAGMVLVDPSHEDMPDRVRLGMPRDEWERWRAERALPNADGVVENAVARRARRSRLPDIPVTIITAAIRRNDEGWDPRFLNEAARQLHASILRGAISGRHVPAQRSGHDVQTDEPGLVADEIMRMVRSAGR